MNERRIAGAGGRRPGDWVRVRVFGLLDRSTIRHDVASVGEDGAELLASDLVRLEQLEPLPRARRSRVAAEQLQMGHVLQQLLGRFALGQSLGDAVRIAYCVGQNSA